MRFLMGVLALALTGSVLWSVLWPVGALAQDGQDAQDRNILAIKKNCKVKWVDDYAMIKYCMDEQDKAWLKVSDFLAGYEKGSTEQGIVERCALKWVGETGGYDFTMVDYCINEQMTARSQVVAMRDEVGEGSEEYEIILRCANKWSVEGGFDYPMVEYCANEQIKAYKLVQ